MGFATEPRRARNGSMFSHTIIILIISLLFVSPIVASEISVQDDVVLIDGEIKINDDVALAELTSQNPAVKSIELNSRGGDVYTAMQIAKYIRKNKLQTRAVGDCLSACTVAFIGGIDRTLDVDGIIGFHRVLNAKTGEELSLEDPLYNRLTMLTWGLGIDPIRFIQWMTYANHEEIFEPSLTELCGANVLSDC